MRLEVVTSSKLPELQRHFQRNQDELIALLQAFKREKRIEDETFRKLILSDVHKKTAEVREDINELQKKQDSEIKRAITLQQSSNQLESQAKRLEHQQREMKEVLMQIQKDYLSKSKMQTVIARIDEFEQLADEQNRVAQKVGQVEASTLRQLQEFREVV
jgi:hypothetical protein